jgi:hypothetical protein
LGQPWAAKKCLDFEGNNKRKFTEKTSGNSVKELSWNGSLAGEISFGTIFFTPTTSTQIMLVPLTNIIFNSPEKLKNGASVILANYDYYGVTNYDSLEGMLAMVSDEKLCMTQNSEENLKLWWNQEYFDRLLEEINNPAIPECK